MMIPTQEHTEMNQHETAEGHSSTSLENKLKLYEKELRIKKHKIDDLKIKTTNFQNELKRTYRKVESLEKKIDYYESCEIENTEKIKNITIHLYLIYSKRLPNCELCDEFKEKYLKSLQNLPKLINLKPDKFNLIEWKCDWLDRFYKDNPYSFEFSEYGKNWLYAQGRYITKFPSLEVYVTMSNNNIIYRRLDGFGTYIKKKGVEHVFVDCVPPLVDFIRKITKGEDAPLEMLRHYENKLLNDPFLK